MQEIDQITLPAIIFIPEADVLIHVRKKVADNLWEVVKDGKVEWIGRKQYNAWLIQLNYWDNRRIK